MRKPRFELFLSPMSMPRLLCNYTVSEIRETVYSHAYNSIHLKVKIIHKKNPKVSLTDEENLQFNLEVTQKQKHLSII